MRLSKSTCPLAFFKFFCYSVSPNIYTWIDHWADKPSNACLSMEASVNFQWIFSQFQFVTIAKTGFIIWDT